MHLSQNLWVTSIWGMHTRIRRKSQMLNSMPASMTNVSFAPSFCLVFFCLTSGCEEQAVRAKFLTKVKRNAYLLWKLLLSSLLLLHNLGNSSWGLLGLALFELADFVPVVCMVRVIGIQEIELGVIYFILTNSSFKFWTISVGWKKE